MKTIEPIVELFDLEMSEGATNWMDENGKIRDIHKFKQYLTECFEDPLDYILHHFNDSLIESNLIVPHPMTSITLSHDERANTLWNVLTTLYDEVQMERIDGGYSITIELEDLVESN